MSETKITLPEKEMPECWYNIQADMKTPLAPPLNPVTREPLGPEALAPIFPMEVIKQEVSTERWIPIPEPVRDVLRLWRPSPLVRARRLEQALDTPARIYFKYEGVSPSGSHKSNTAVAQVYYNMLEGTRRITTETGAGQWGSALSMACHFFGLECQVYMVKVSYHQKPYRRSLMQLYGGDVVASPSDRTAAGREAMELDPETPGSLAIAISEAVQDAISRDDSKYALGSVLNHVILHQTVIGLEAKKQLEIAGDYPDVVIGCAGGGSNFGGIAFPFVKDKIEGKKVRALAVEPTACPTLTRGVFHYDFGDVAQMTPMMMMHTLGHDFMPSGIHAGGLRYHGMSPLVSQLLADGYIEARAYPQNPVFAAAVQFAQSEGIVPAPESAHAIRAAVDEALRCKEEGRSEVILFNLSGHGHFDLSAYDTYLGGKLEDFAYPDEKLADSLARVQQL